MLSFWNETLKNISQDQRKDKFVFIVNKIRYEIPLSYALGISPYITKQYLNDPTFREFEIKIENVNTKEDNNIKKNIEEEFSNFLRGKEIRKEVFLEIGKILQK